MFYSSRELGNFLVNILKLSLVSYVIGISILWISLDYRVVHSRRLDYLKGSVDYPVLYLDKKVSLNRRYLKEVVRYYHELIAFLPYLKGEGDQAMPAARAYEMLGLCYYFLEDYSKANLFYQKALKKKPDYIWMHYNVAVLYFKEARYDKSLEELSFIALDQIDQIKSSAPDKIFSQKDQSIKLEFERIKKRELGSLRLKVINLTILNRRALNQFSDEEGTRQEKILKLMEQKGVLVEPWLHPLNRFVPVGREPILTEAKATGLPVDLAAVLARGFMPRASGDPKGRPLT